MPCFELFELCNSYNAIFKHKHTTISRTYISNKNALFSKYMANYAIFILVPNIYNPILNIKAAMCTKCYTNY